MTDVADKRVLGNAVLIHGQEDHSDIYRAIQIDDEGRIVVSPA